MRRRSMLVLVLTLAGAVLVPSPGWACSCAPSTVAEDVAAADGVYIARPRATTKGAPGRGEVAFDVERILAGPDRQTLEVPVWTGSTAACGTQLRDAPYVVLVHGRAVEEQILCTEHLVGDAAVAAARQVLGEGRAPPAADPTTVPLVVWLAAGLIGLVGVAVTGAWRLTRRRRA